VHAAEAFADVAGFEQYGHGSEARINRRGAEAQRKRRENLIFSASPFSAPLRLCGEM
jgi:hypothetical protein